MPIAQRKKLLAALKVKKKTLPLKGFKKHSDGRCHRIERVSVGDLAIARRQLQTEAVIFVSRENMKMRVEHLLTRNNAVGEEPVDSIAAE